MWSDGNEAKRSLVWTDAKVKPIAPLGRKEGGERRRYMGGSRQSRAQGYMVEIFRRAVA